MPFDLATAQPVAGGFDLASARPVGEDDRSREIPAPSPRGTPERIPPPQPSTLERIGGAIKGVGGLAETGASMVSGLVGTAVGNVAGAARTAMSGSDFGTPEGIHKGGETAGKVRDFLTYQPRSEVGQDMTESVGKLMAPLEGLPPHMAVPAAGATAGSVAESAGGAAAKVRDLLPGGGKPAMAGVGAAETAGEAMRRERAGGLPQPISLTKGQASREFEQQRFERETAKTDAGKPLREKYEEQNRQVLQNFDAWIDQTGAQAPSLYHVGKAVDVAIVEKAERAKTRITTAYDRARKAGEMNQMIPTDDLVAYLEKNRPAAVNAGVLTGAEQKLVALGGARQVEGKLVAAPASINDLEELRKFIGAMGGKDATNAHFAKDLKRTIDQATEGRGGELYREARKLRSDFAREFEDHAVIDKLLSTKPGTADRAVAFEDVFDHSVLKGSQDDLKILRRTLQTAGEKGEQAWRELQGQTISYLRGEATKAVQTDAKGARTVSPAALDKAVMALDRDGKLDVMFGKRAANQLRELNDIAKDVYTSLPGTINSSNNVSMFRDMLNEWMENKGLGTGTIKAIGAMKNAFAQRKLRGRVRDALDDPTIRDLSQKERGMRVSDLMEES